MGTEYISMEAAVDRPADDRLHRLAERSLFKRVLRALVGVFFLIIPLSACGGLPSFPGASLFSGNSRSAVDEEAAPAELYKEADLLLGAQKFESAAKKFEEVDRQHPYSPYARRAIVLSAYSHFQAGQYDEAIQGANRYITLHPGTKEAPLARHILASSYFEQISTADHDQSRTKRALKALRTLVRLHPESRYAKLAYNRIRISKDVLAAQEMSVGRYYLKRNNHLSAINRFKTVVVEYQTTNHVKEALMRLAESYMAIGVVSEAQTAVAVLGHNFPESKWYKDAYVLLKSDGLVPREDSGSWISQAWKKTVKGIQAVTPL